MADSVAWKAAIFHDGQQALTLEDSIRRCAGYAGLHDYDFADSIDEDFVAIDDWTVDTTDGTTWVVATGALVVTGGGGAVWYQAVENTEVEPSFVASFDMVTGEGGFIIHGKNAANDAYIAYWDAGACGIGTISDAKALTKLTELPYPVAGPAHIQVAVKWRLDSVDDSRKWLLISLYVDGREFACYADDIGTGDWTGDEVGFAVFDSDTLTVDNFTISEIGRIVDYTSVDCGETPAMGLSRAIGTTRLRYQARYDGTLRVWRPGNRAEDWAIPAERRVVKTMARKARTEAMTHIRMIGATHAVDRFLDTEGDIHLHRFRMQDDPNVVSESETYAEGGRVLNDAKEMQTQARLQIAGQPLVEPSDRVGYDSDDWRVRTLNHIIQGESWGTMLEVQEYLAV